MLSMIPNRRIGLLDVGSNSVRLMVCDLTINSLKSIYYTKITCRLIEGMQGGMLSQDSIRRTNDAIRALCDAAREKGAEYIYAFGTSAMRDGENRDEVLNNARSYGVRFQVLSGEQEAYLAYAGIARSGKIGIIDIGGGSTEFITADNGRILSAASSKMGAVRFGDHCQHRIDPEMMLEKAKAALWENASEASKQGISDWIGEGGTITALGALSLQLEKYDSQKLSGTSFTRKWLRKEYSLLCSLDTEGRKALKGMEIKRADLIPFGTALLLAAMEILDIEKISVATSDNIIGYAQEYVRSTLFPVENKGIFMV